MNGVFGLRCLVALAIAGVLGGCAFTKVTDTPRPSWIAPPGPSAVPLVMIAADGKFKSINYPGSGRLLAERVAKSVRHKYPNVEVVFAKSEAEALKACTARGATHLICPRILHWEDRATWWSGIRDYMQVEVKLLQVDPYKLVAAKTFAAASNSQTVMAHSPEDFLNEDFEEVVLDLLN